MSYNGGMDFGLLGDYDAMPDLDELGRDLEVALEELAGRRQEGDEGHEPQRRPRRSAPRQAQRRAAQ